MIKASSLKPGDVVYDCHKHRMGNTTMSEMGVWKVEILSVEPSKTGPENRVVTYSWNNNKPKTRDGDVFDWRRAPPEWIVDGWHGYAKCHSCSAKRDAGHTPTCSHPRAVAARKRGAK